VADVGIDVDNAADQASASRVVTSLLLPLT
jgi:hypothetical protein